jgi:hypothetical protein
MAVSDGMLIDATGAVMGGRSVFGAYHLAGEHLRRFREDPFDLLLKRNYINGAAAAIRRSAAQSALPLPCDMPHDYWLAIWCALQGGIALTPESLYRYRLHPQNVIGIGIGNPLYDWLSIWKHPTAPRERELRIWQAVTERIATVGSSKQLVAAESKLAWLRDVAPHGRNTLRRALAIFRSALNGSYYTYSARPALLRDIVSLIR